MSGSIRVQANGQTLAVNFTRTNGAAASVFSDAGLTSAVSLPATISSDTYFYFPTPETYVVSVKLNGVEIASNAGSTLTQFLHGNSSTTIAPSVDGFTERAAVDAGAYSAGRTLTPSGVAVTDTIAMTAAVALSAVDGLPIRFADGRHRFTSAIAWDPTKHSIEGSGSTILDFTAMTTGAAVTVSSDNTSGQAFKQIKNRISNLTFEGPTSEAATVDWLDTTPVSGHTNPNVSLRNIMVSGFRDGLLIGDQTWCLVAERVSMSGQTRRCINYTAQNNAGENLSFYGCTFHDSHNAGATAVALYVPTTTADPSFFFFGCSFTYNDLQMDIKQGTVELHGCHMEDSNTGAMVKVTSSGGGTSEFKMFGGRVFIPTSASARTCIVDHISGTSSVVTFSGTRFTTYTRDYEIVKTTAGTPIVRLANTLVQKSDDVAASLKQVVPGDACNLLYNPGWETGNVDGWTTSGSVGTPTVQTTKKNSGTYALKFVGTGVAGQRIYSQAFKVKPGDTVVAKTALLIENYVGGTVTLYLRAIDVTGSTLIAADSLSFTANIASWTTYKRHYIVPAGTAEIRYWVVFDTINGDVYMDDSYLAVV